MRKVLFLILFFPFFVLSQDQEEKRNNQNVFNLDIADYSITIKLIKEIDSLILINKKLLMEDVINKAAVLESQSYFETDESYISRIYNEIYNSFSYYDKKTNTTVVPSKWSQYLTKIDSLNSRRISLRNNVFIGDHIKLEFIDSLYDANSEKWIVSGSHNISDLIKQKKPTESIGPIELDVKPEIAKYFYNNIDELEFEGVYSIKYGKIDLIAIRIISPNYNLSYRFRKFDYLRIENPINDSSRSSRKRVRGVDSIITKVIHREPIDFIEFSNSDKFLAFGGKKSFFLHSFETGFTDTLLFHTEVSVEVINPNYGGFHDRHYENYQINNVHEWNIDRKVLGNGSKIGRLIFGIDDIEFSPNDSILILSISTTYPTYSENPFASQLLIYNLYSKKFSSIGSKLTDWEGEYNSRETDNPYRNITFPYYDNNSFYCIYNNSSICKIDINSREQKDYFIQYDGDPIGVQDFKLSYDKQFFLINDTIIYNNKKELLLSDYRIPAPYYNLFNEKFLRYIFPLPFENDYERNLDIRCPGCGDDYLELKGNNIFECPNGYYNCRSSFVIFNNEFFEINDRISFSKNNKDLIANVYSIGYNNIKITHTISQACSYIGGYLDKCGNCVGGRTGKNPCQKDCNGDYGGDAFLDDCKVCVGGNTGIMPNMDKDSCDICFGDNSTCKDCNDILYGTSFLDNCGNCVGGNTGKLPCKKDCNGDYGGQAFIDDCNRCVGGNSFLAPCRKKYFENGNLKVIYHESSNNKLLYEENYFENGIVKNRISYEDSDRYEINYDDKGNLHGKVTYWYNNSQIKRDTEYINGKLSRKTHYYYFFDGSVSEKIVMYAKYGMVHRYDMSGIKIEKYKCDRNGAKIQ
tara:strand:- start:668 stop:3253 length:2586 start_codon:yes stop_codon:yes gene_type:complete